MDGEDRIAEPWGRRTPYASEWPARVDRHLADGVMPEDVDRWVQGASVLHSNGDAFDYAVKDGRVVGVRGRAGDRVNRGRLGPKDLYGWQHLHSPDRLTRPLVRDGGELREASWDEAMERVVARARRQLDTYGGGSIGFYTSGQLALEEYYTLAVIGKAGLGTPHMDGNTRLCTATAGQALKETFGTDGQPGSYDDFDHADVVALFGHNMAATQSVLWSRVLDRRAGPDPPRIVAVDPRSTPVTREADVHLAIRSGTNLALLNGLLREVIMNGWVDEAFVARSTRGFDGLREVVMGYPPERVAAICGIEPGDLRDAARTIGTAERLVSTVLQGVYQSTSATAAACQVNNLHLIRGMIGRPGASVFQFNGQPTAQNTRETGADGDLPGFRNWANAAHVQELADLWNVDALVIPHWAPPTHAMQIWRYAEQGSIGLLWISATNPAVSLPQLARIRDVLRSPQVLVVAQDIFRTETTELADVVLPAATWGEKTGTFTNVDRTVHLSEAAVEPPGEARSDLDIFLDFARRMDFRDRGGEPLIKWQDPESAFEAWKACSAGRPCDYSGLSYARLRGPSGIQWGGERLYPDGVFNTDPDYCETYNHDLVTGAVEDETEYRAKAPAGRAHLLAAEYQPPQEEPSDEYPFALTTGRTLYQFHTRTKTGRAPELDAAAPRVWAELSAQDAGALGVEDGETVRIVSPRGTVEAPVRIAGIRPGLVFVPFHYGDHAANELTMTAWDPTSKQPYFKVAAVRVERAELMQLPVFLGLLHRAETALAEAFRAIAAAHADEPDVHHLCRSLADQCEGHAERLRPSIERYGERDVQPDLERFGGTRSGGLGLLRDLHDLYVMVSEVDVAWILVGQAAQALRDRELLAVVEACGAQTATQLKWLRTRLEQAAPQALVTAP